MIQLFGGTTNGEKTQKKARLSKPDRTGRSNRLNREPNLNPVRLACKTGPRLNREKTAEPAQNRKKPGRFKRF
jgi:hypothetical protein